MLLFDENDTCDWQHSIREALMSDFSNDQHVPENIIDHLQQPGTDIECGDAKLSRNLICTASELAR